MNSEKGEIAHILQETRICFPKAMHKGSQQPMPLSVRNLMPSFVRWTPLLTLHMFNQVYYCCNERPWSKQLVYGGAHRYLAYASISLVIIKGSQKRNSNRIETKKKELMQKSLLDYFCLLACSPWIIHPALYRTYGSLAWRLKHSR